MTLATNQLINNDLFVAHSSIHGEGVFANRDFQVGELISPDCLCVGEFRGYNHSCSPNLGSHLVINGQSGIREVISPIMKGEELVCQYYFRPADPYGSTPFICNCPSCRGNNGY